jgi:hypothetical protein
MMSLATRNPNKSAEAVLDSLLTIKPSPPLRTPPRQRAQSKGSRRAIVAVEQATLALQEM